MSISLHSVQKLDLSKHRRCTLNCISSIKGNVLFLFLFTATFYAVVIKDVKR